MFEKNIGDELTFFDKHISNFRNDFETKNAQINTLEIRMEELEKETREEN